MLIVLALGGGFGAAFLGALAGVVVAFGQRETFPRPHDSERELRLLTLRLRSPWRARLARWMRE